MSEIQNYADNLYSLQQIKSKKFVKASGNFDPEVAIIEVLEIFQHVASM